MAEANDPVNTEPPARRFFHYFQREVTALQQQMGQLKDIANAGGERKDGADHCRDGITRLSNEIRDASSYLPSFDQRTYGEAIKALNEELNKIRESFIPPSRFTFKTARRNPSAVSLGDVAELAAQDKRLVPGYQSPMSSAQPSISPSPNLSPTLPNADATSTMKNLSSTGDSSVIKTPAADNSNISQRPTRGPPKTPHSTIYAIDISHQFQKHILLPSTPARLSTPATLGYLEHCAVDLSMNSTKVIPFASLTLKNIKECLLIGGEIDGATHVNEVANSVVVIAQTGQLRLHNCKNVQVYLRCRSRPIIEHCEGIAFAKLPNCLQPTEPDDHRLNEVQNMWDKVDDFNWLRSEPNPHWRTMAPEEEVPDEVWTDIVPGGPGWSLDEILKATKVL